MAATGCTLSAADLAAQLDRYQRLGKTALRVEERELALVIFFATSVDRDLLQETILVERGCCSFFTLDYDESARRLSIAVDNSESAEVLRPLLSALRGLAASPADRRSR
jgi:hypothetical protein